MRFIYSNLNVVTADGPVEEHNRTFFIPLHCHYSLAFTNSEAYTTEYVILIDGIVVGTWRLERNQQLTIRCPVERPFKFWFTQQTSVPVESHHQAKGTMIVYEYICDDVSTGFGIGDPSQRFKPFQPLKRTLAAVFFLEMKPVSEASSMDLS